ncbi:MAG: ABC transporter permease [Planctomycetes bacterium]|nr:ABC transporter permease [Planctomycetota bacterium]
MSFTDRPIWQLFLVRWREMSREPGVIFWVFGFPIVLAVALGLAFRNKPPEVQVIAVVESAGAVGVQDAAATNDAATNQAVAAAVAAIDAIEGMKAERLDVATAAEWLRSGKALLVLDPGDPPRFTLDPTRPGGRLAEIAVRDALEHARDPTSRLAVTEEIVTAPGRRYIDFLLPGLLGMNLMSGGVWGVGWALVLMRTRKLLKRFAATPMRRSDLLLSFMLFRIVISLVEALFLVAFGVVAFAVVPRGSWLDLVALVALSALAFGGLGLLVASRAQNSQSAAGLMNLVTMPMFLLSGVFFPADNFPAWMQPVVKVLPLTALNDALRAVILDGSALSATWPQLAILAAWGVLCFSVALRVFRWL